MLNELDPEVKALLEQVQANAAQHPAPAIPLSATEKIIATRQMVRSFAALRYPAESVLRTLAGQAWFMALPRWQACSMRARFSSIGLGLRFAKRSNRLQTQIHINLAEEGATTFRTGQAGVIDAPL